MSKEGSNAGAVLESLLSRVEKLKEEQAALGEDIKVVKGEAKAQGFDTATFNEMLKLRRMDPEKRSEREHLRDTYMAALDMI